MKWVQINNAYFNTDAILAFYWSRGKLWIYWWGNTEAEAFDDPKRENYNRLCNRLAVSPVEGEKQ